MTTPVWAAVPLNRIPRNPEPVPVPPLLIVIVPILLLEMISPDWKLKSNNPKNAQVLVVVVVLLITILDEPSRLPMVLPVVPPTSNKPAVEPTEIPMNPEVVVVPPWLVVWLKPEIVLACMLVATVVLVL